jgi:hypothetical protein
MAGNVAQWNESLVNVPDPVVRYLPGTTYLGTSNYAISSDVNLGESDTAFYPDFFVGFRLASVANVPEPSTLVLAALACLSLLAWGRRGRGG